MIKTQIQVEKKLGKGIEEQFIHQASDYPLPYREWKFVTDGETNDKYDECFNECKQIKDIVKAPSGEYMALSRLYDYDNFQGIIEQNAVELNSIARKMFPNTNPLTMKPDLLSDTYFTPYIPITVANNTMIVQKKDGKEYFNPEGTVSVAELLDGFVAIRYGANHNENRAVSLDNISDENDYFNEGYNECIDSYSSLFNGLYTRRELMHPITRLELGYITVLCWRRFREHFDTLYGGAFDIGISFDWEDPYSILRNFEDGFDYKVSVITDETEGYRLNLKDYKTGSVSEYLKDLKEGNRALPFPMFMSLLELRVLGLFYFEGDKLSPLKEVSRGEFCYFINQIANTFRLKYIA